VLVAMIQAPAQLGDPGGRQPGERRPRHRLQQQATRADRRRLAAEQCANQVLHGPVAAERRQRLAESGPACPI
jgi:hypothetical protein